MSSSSSNSQPTTAIHNPFKMVPKEVFVSKLFGNTGEFIRLGEIEKLVPADGETKYFTAKAKIANLQYSLYKV